MDTNARTRLRIVPGVLLFLMFTASCGSETHPEAATAESTGASPIDHGVWRELPEAPIAARPYAVAGWSGSEVFFWAGSNLRRDFAHTTGAAYDPESATWRELPVPGWGHPGTAGAVFEGQLYVAAKGGASRIDPSDGSATDLPSVPGFTLATLVAAGGALWGLGPASGSDEAPVQVGIARYDGEADVWVSGPLFEGAPQLGNLFRGLQFVEQTVVWTGSELVVWSQNGLGLSFDPAAESWRLLPPIVLPQGTLKDSAIAVAGSRLVALVEVEDGDTRGHGVASWDGQMWTWRDTDIDVADFALVTIAGADGWILVFSPHRPPYTVHIPSGASIRHENAPIAGVQSPNVVWTGDELVIWGGVTTLNEDDRNPPRGAAWTPPST